MAMSISQERRDIVNALCDNLNLYKSKGYLPIASPFVFADLFNKLFPEWHWSVVDNHLHKEQLVWDDTQEVRGNKL